PALGRIFSNAPLRQQDRVEGTGPAKGHTLLDMGADEFTQGRLHPMIDPSLRLLRLAQEAADPDVGVLLLDVVLGFGADRDPAGTLAPAVAEARRRALDAGRYLCVVGSLCGTDEDPQDLRAQEAALLEAGMVLEGSNARAARLAGRILVGRGARSDGAASGPDDGAPPVLEVEAEASSLPDPGQIPRLLSSPPQVINVGLELFAESLAAQSVPVIHLDWRPPAGGKKHLQDLLERLEA
ncbi:MAG TPA: protein FdrA, partial [bacterium]|nr:protein FdrA [bacterium]